MIIDKQSDPKLKFKKLNIFAYAVGLLSAFGISLVGNFQETNVLSIHLIGNLKINF
jgi:hypothetical protein